MDDEICDDYNSLSDAEGLNRRINNDQVYQKRGNKR